MQLPEGATSDVVAPHAHFDQKQQQQVVVWLAQDVYGAYMERAQNVDDQLKMVKLWRDLVVFLSDWRGHARMQQLVAEAWGKDGAQMLGEIENDNWRRFAFPSS